MCGASTRGPGAAEAVIVSVMVSYVDGKEAV
jgi:hypothetical protein